MLLLQLMVQFGMFFLLSSYFSSFMYAALPWRVVFWEFSAMFAGSRFISSKFDKTSVLGTVPSA